MGLFVNGTVVFSSGFSQLRPALCNDENALSGDAPNKATRATAMEIKPINARKDKSCAILNEE